MKKTLFRGKQVDSADWYFGYFRKISNCYYIYGMNRLEEHEVDPKTIGEWTSLLDRNETLVFEGDIVKDLHGNIGEVFWDDIVLSWRITYNKFGKVWLSNEENMEVLGNIYDNPELLEERKNQTA